MKKFLKSKIPSKLSNNFFNNYSGLKNISKKRGIYDIKIGNKDAFKYSNNMIGNARIYRQYSTEENLPEEDLNTEYDRKLKEKKEKEIKRREEFNKLLEDKKLEEKKTLESEKIKRLEDDLEKKLDRFEKEEREKKMKVHFDYQLIIKYLQRDSQINNMVEVLLDKLSKLGKVTREDLKRLGFPPYVETAEEALKWTREAEERKQLWYLFLTTMMDVQNNDPSWRDNVWVLLDNAKTEEEKKLWSEMYHMEKRYEDIIIPLGSVVRNTLTSLVKSSIRSRKRLEDFSYYSDYLKEKTLSLFGNMYSDFIKFMEDPIEKRSWYNQEKAMDQLLSENELYLDMEPTFYDEKGPRITRDPVNIKTELDNVTMQYRLSQTTVSSSQDLFEDKRKLINELKDAKLARRKNRLGVPLLNFQINKDGIMYRIYYTLIGSYIGYFILFLFAVPFLFQYKNYIQNNRRKEEEGLYFEQRYISTWVSKFSNFMADYISKDSVFMHNMGDEVFFNPEEVLLSSVETQKGEVFYMYLPLHGYERTAFATITFEKWKDQRNFDFLALRPTSIFIDFSDTTTYFAPIEDDCFFNFYDWLEFKTNPLIEIPKGKRYPNFFENKHGAFDWGFGASPTRFTTGTLQAYGTIRVIKENIDRSYYFSHLINPVLRLPTKRTNEINSFFKKKKLSFLDDESEPTTFQIRRCSLLLDHFKSPKVLSNLSDNDLENLFDSDLSDNDVAFYLNNIDLQNQQKQAFEMIQHTLDNEKEEYLQNEVMEVDQLPLVTFDQIPVFSKQKWVPPTKEFMTENIQYLTNNLMFRPVEENDPLTWKKSRHYIKRLNENGSSSSPLLFDVPLSQFPVEYFLSTPRVYDKYDQFANDPNYLFFLSETEKKRVLSDLNDSILSIYPAPDYLKWHENRKPFFLEEIFPSTFANVSTEKVEVEVNIEDSSQIEEILELRNIVEEEMAYDPALKTAVFHHLNHYLEGKNTFPLYKDRFVSDQESKNFAFFRRFRTRPHTTENIDKPTNFYP